MDKEILDGSDEVTTFSFSHDWYYPWWSNGTLDYNQQQEYEVLENWGADENAWNNIVTWAE